MAHIDHLVWIASSLEAGVTALREATGLAASPGGQHPQLGTHNALALLGDRNYVEALAPDPALAPWRGPASAMAELGDEIRLTWALRSDDLDAIAARLIGTGLSVRGPEAWSRRSPDGATLSWRLLFIDDAGFRGLAPFLIDWETTPHPTEAKSTQGRLRALTLETPDPKPLQDLMALIGASVEIEIGPEPRLHAVFEVGATSAMVSARPLALT